MGARLAALLVALLVAVILAGCGAAGGTTATAPGPAMSPAYRARIERIARTRCQRLGAAALARLLHVQQAPTAIAAAYARTWPPPVRAAARNGCLRGLR